MGRKRRGRNRGICQLTGDEGDFVDSHLLPKALTKAGGLQNGLIQAGRGRRPERRHSSWYDNSLVTSKGEKILADLDDWAIRELRCHQLVWSGWGPMHQLKVQSIVPNSPFGIRILKGADWKRLRLFFLSLLWRAAATRRYEFDEISLEASDREMLRDMIVAGNAEPIEYFGLQLIQLSTMGVEHILTPIADIKSIGSDLGDPYEVPFFRFYFDGLIAHFDRRPTAEIR